MDSIFRTRGSGVSSDVENTIVPQLLSEIDGVEGLENVIVIGASNREDMIDPAILRPGRLDVKIKIERPDAEAARDIFSKYILPGLPIHAEDLAEHGGDAEATVAAMIQHTVERMYTESEENRFLEVTYANGDKETLYFKDFNSGAMIQNIVDRGKKMAIKDLLTTGAARPAHAAPARRVRRRVPRERGPARTPPTPTTGRGSPARRASGSSTSARSSPAARAPRPAARSTPWATPASTCSRRRGPVTFWQGVLVAVAGIWAGTINTVVGSGTLVTFPVLLGVGLPPVTANVSNTVGLFPGSFVGAYGYRRELDGQAAGRDPRRGVLPRGDRRRGAAARAAGRRVQGDRAGADRARAGAGGLRRADHRVAGRPRPGREQPDHRARCGSPCSAPASTAATSARRRACC